ncbi:MAG TPA: hypothetical protein P5248_00360, partial [Bacteroidales bacterium]|nr:hypothetical protein [Bacteroidales bacterium]
LKKQGLITESSLTSKQEWRRRMRTLFAEFLGCFEVDARDRAKMPRCEEIKHPGPTVITYGNSRNQILK